MSEFSLLESRERFVEGLKRAASNAVDMGKAQDKAEWFLIAQQLNEMLKAGIKIIDGKTLTPLERELALEKTKELM